MKTKQEFDEAVEKLLTTNLVPAQLNEQGVPEDRVRDFLDNLWEVFKKEREGIQESLSDKIKNLENEILHEKKISADMSETCKRIESERQELAKTISDSKRERERLVPYAKAVVDWLEK